MSERAWLASRRQRGFPERKAPEYTTPGALAPSSLKGEPEEHRSPDVTHRALSQDCYESLMPSAIRDLNQFLPSSDL